jgi:hypothetical protein
MRGQAIWPSGLPSWFWLSFSDSGAPVQLQTTAKRLFQSPPVTW